MKKAILATAITAAIASPVVQANADPMTIVITASRFEQNVTQSLAPVTVITQQQLKQSQPRSVAQALQQAAGIQVVNSGGYGQTSNLYMRGLDQKRMLVLVDGVQVGSATLGTASLEHFPLDQIDRIEVVRGARSSLYGSKKLLSIPLTSCCVKRFGPVRHLLPLITRVPLTLTKNLILIYPHN